MYRATQQGQGIVELELTESGLISNGHAASEQLRSLAEAGIKIAIDDFGTGYSSLTYLQKITADIVKIDRSFIKRLDDDNRSRSLVRSMIAMAHDLGYTVVAEGVETWSGYRFLRELGCDELQGYLFSKPLRAAHFERWLNESPPVEIKLQAPSTISASSEPAGAVFIGR